ncbi:sulfatase-like hydrolase/transferase [bacterium]|nr:sulfatase-like hydrolase/transferase [bacterium]
METVVLLLFHLELTVLTVSSLAQDAFTFFPWLVWGGIAAVIAVFCGLAFLLSRRQAYLFTSKFPSFCLGFFCIIVILGVLCGISSPLPANMFITNGKILFARLPEVEDFHLFGKHTTYQDYFHSVKGKQHRPNIILLFAESLSPIDSLRIGGVHDNLPNFDRISADGMTFTNFVNNGCTSDTAHVAMLRGIEPLGKASYTGFQTILESLPEFLKTQGYSTTFLSAVSLDFFGQKGFLEAMDFDEIIGEEAFEDRKKYVFDAAPDGDLYEKALEILKKKQKEYQADAPYALLLQSISYHKPYSTPYGETEESSIKYSDEMLGNFYDSLKKS